MFEFYNVFLCVGKSWKNLNSLLEMNPGPQPAISNITLNALPEV
jgi:hypothetical protein